MEMSDEVGWKERRGWIYIYIYGIIKDEEEVYKKIYFF